MTLAQTLAPWHDFYMLLGQASATMTGLLFVAASVGSDAFSRGRPGALRMFLSASVVQFGCILITCLIVLAPLTRFAEVGGAAVGCGLFGLGYSAMAWRDTMRDGILEKIDLDDRIWYAAAPAVGYLLETVAGLALLIQAEFCCVVLAVSVCMLLLAAIHNAWDITVWSVTRRKG